MSPATAKNEVSPADVLTAFRALSDAQANEAETRLKLINQILFGVLGWTHNDVEVEKKAQEDGSTTFADYVCTTASSRFVIEAKRVGQSFDELPDVRRAMLRGKIMSGVTGDTIKQARDYGRKLSVGFAVATNGTQWVVFPVNRRDGVQFSDSSAIIFPSLESVLRDDFAEFYDLLSRDAVISGSLDSELIGRIEDQLEDRRLNRHFARSFTRRTKSSLYNLVQEAVVVAFTEDSIADDPELLEKCYVQTPERTRFDSRIKMYIAKRDSVTTTAPKRPLKKDSRALLDVIEHTARGQKALAVLVIGLVGSGKTTFLNYTSKVSARALLTHSAARPTPHWVYVDYRDLSAGEPSMPFLQRRLRDHISSDEFLSDYNRCIRHAYKDELDALMRGPLFLLADDEVEKKRRIADLIMRDMNDVTPYVEKILSYASKNAPVFLVIDNVDQFDDEVFQTQIFSDAMALSRRIGANLMLSMRDATYMRHRASPVLDAFDFDPIYIDPPVIEAVLSKRFFIARQILSGKPISFITETGVRMDIEDSGVVLDIVQSSVLGTEVGEMIDVLAGSDVRLALRMTREFLQYGYSSTGHALNVYQATGKYVLPKHEALRGILLGNQSIYNSAHSVIRNPFDAQLGRSDAQLLRLFILSALVNFGGEATFKGLGGDQIRDAVRAIGFGDEITKKVLIDLVDARFALTTSHQAPTFEASFVASRLGGHIVRQFISNFAFLENVLMDTFITETVVWNELRDEISKVYQQRDRVRRMEHRVNAVNMFFDYMSECYSVLSDESSKRGLRREWCVNPFAAAQSQLSTNIDAVLASARRPRPSPAAG